MTVNVQRENEPKNRDAAEQTNYEWQKRLELAQKAGLRIGLWDWDVVANTLIWSDETYRQFGYTRDTFSGRVEEAVKRIHPEDRPKVEDAIRKVIAGEGDYAQQYRLVWPDGTTCWVDAHGVMVRNGSNHMLGIGVDITNLKKVEQSLQESEDKYRLLLNSTAEAIYGLDLKGNCTFCNPACVHILGYGGTEDLLGKNMHQLMHHTRVDGTPYPEEDCEIYVAINEGRASHVDDDVLWRADGTCFPAEYWSYPMCKTGELVGAVVTFLDISTRRTAELAVRESEQKHRELFENATYGIFRSTTDGALLEVNPALVSMLGYGSKDELLAKNLNRDIYEEPHARASILEKYGPGGRVDGDEVKWRRKDGKSIAVRLSGRAVPGMNGATRYFEVIAEDVTERRSLEAQLRQAQKMEAVGHLAAGIAHDFNNILMGISSYAELLHALNGQDVKKQSYTQQILAGCARAAEVVQQLLVFGRKHVSQQEPVNLHRVLEGSQNLIRQILGPKCELSIELTDDQLTVIADRVQLEQMVLNIASNARDAMRGGGVFRVGVTRLDLLVAQVNQQVTVAPGSYASLTFADTGVGIAPEIVPHIFEPFFTTKTTGEGTGLGLAMVYGEVKHLGGYIFIDSELGSGSKFTMLLPLTNQPASWVRKDLRIGCASTAMAGTGIMLVDDELQIRVSCAEYLNQLGYVVFEASNAEKALKLFELNPSQIKLLLTDLVMPGMGGVELARQLRQRDPQLAVIFMSGFSSSNAELQKVSFSEMLAKPVALADLGAVVARMLRQQHSERGEVSK